MTGVQTCALPISLLHDMCLRLNVGRNHAIAEGFQLSEGDLLQSYDRVEHPWMHGRRPHDVAEAVEAFMTRWMDRVRA